MAKLHQVIAAEKTVKAVTNKTIDELYKTAQKEGLFTGLTRTYNPKDDDGEQLPAESTKVQQKSEEILAELTERWAELVNVTLSKDTANCDARADITVNGEVLASGVPVTTLLWLEKQLTDLATVIGKMPMLDPATDWIWDQNSGVFRSNETQTIRTRKVPKVLLKAEATKEHAAQTEVFHEDIPVGTWTAVRFSGALPESRIHDLAGRVTDLQKAVRYARQEANMIDAPNIEVGSRLFGWVLNGA